MILRNIKPYQRFCKKNLSKWAYRELIIELPDTISVTILAAFAAFLASGDFKQAYDYYMSDDSLLGVTYRTILGLWIFGALMWQLKTKRKEKKNG